ncbi:hypothetical protein BDW74DRAFT_41489 [Aspergillus multicolor]|uniref:uncharacterized protein n=1 Tax=Aspergillus multicolor TaxID=41759 RepID=UPI003CCE0D4B
MSHQGFPLRMTPRSFALSVKTLIIVALCGIIGLSKEGYRIPPQYPLDHGVSNIQFSEEWQVLGPFQCGTRGIQSTEAIWGADPLEYQGGFRNLSFDKKAEYSSSLSTDGVVKWGQAWANVTNPHTGQSRAELMVAFPEVNWPLLQSVYGWSAKQYQAWIRGHLYLHGSNRQAVAIFTDSILDLFIDGERHFGGDFYSYRRAPLILDVTPGEHLVELRLIRDVRALGGQGDPTINVVIESKLRYSTLTIDERSLLIPEATDQKLGSTWASINVQNNAPEWVEILSVYSLNFSLMIEVPLYLAPYQTRPLAFRFTAGNPPRFACPFEVRYKVGQQTAICIQSFPVEFTEKDLFQSQRITYAHPAGIVSYAILRPPPLHSLCASSRFNASLPLIIGLHGAGLDADSVEARGMLDAAYGICAWMLFPSGVTSWSGDDWHTWGVDDIKAAVQAIPDWMEAVGWSGPGALVDDWMVIGHSNGGQGVWYLATHYPDNVFAAAPVSGYTSIENYVPYNMWRDSEPLISSILYRSRASYKHELLLVNAAGIPILQQHSSQDTNVPAYHSRLMHALLEEADWFSEYVELPNAGHWFEGVMTTPPLLKFYENSLHLTRNQIPSSFAIHVPPSGDMGSKGGIFVDQLESPDRFGRLHVTIDAQRKTWHLQTQNIHRFHLLGSACDAETHVVLIIDDMSTRFAVDPAQCDTTWYIRTTDGNWMRSEKANWRSISQRYGRQVGALDAILRTNGTFTINICSANVEKTALQISRNLLQYFAADSHIVRRCDPSDSGYPGNVITISLGNELPGSVLSTYPLHITDGRITFHRCLPEPGTIRKSMDLTSTTNCGQYIINHEPAMGALFLRPLPNERLELVVWGTDRDGLEQAARLVPTLTGAGQPEFLVLGETFRWKGHAGLHAAGHFNKLWQISAGSYFADGI